MTDEEVSLHSQICIVSTIIITSMHTVTKKTINKIMQIYPEKDI